MRTILLIIVGLSATIYADFTKSGNIVTDSKTGLQWQDDDIGTTATWQDAIDRCENLTLDGFSDWRLPNINELKSIIDRTKKDPAIAEGFKNSRFSHYWSSTAYQLNSNLAWVVLFSDGYVDSYSKDSNYYVRCVRAGQ